MVLSTLSMTLVLGTDCTEEQDRCCYSRPCDQDGLHLPPEDSFADYNCARWRPDRQSPGCYSVHSLLQGWLLPGVVPVLPHVRLPPPVWRLQGVRHIEGELCGEVGGGRVRGRDLHHELHHQEKHLQASHSLRGGRDVCRGSLQSRVL